MTLRRGDCLELMETVENGSVDLIYMDPPFNSKRNHGEFDDRWESSEKYIGYIRERVAMMRDRLKPDGSLLLHCDQSESHYLKVMLDGIFGRKRFQNEIIWCYGGRGNSKTRYQRKHDSIFFYTKGADYYFSREDASRPVNPKYVGRYNKTDEKGRRYARIKNKDGTYGNAYLKDVVREDWWEMPYVRGDEVLGYPTQKPLSLLKRLVAVHCPPDGIVMDPMCGSGTTGEAAISQGRGFIGFDVSREAIRIANERLFHAAAKAHAGEQG